MYAFSGRLSNAPTDPRPVSESGGSHLPASDGVWVLLSSECEYRNRESGVGRAESPTCDIAPVHVACRYKACTVCAVGRPTGREAWSSKLEARRLGAQFPVVILPGLTCTFMRDSQVPGGHQWPALPLVARRSEGHYTRLQALKGFCIPDAAEPGFPGVVLECGPWSWSTILRAPQGSSHMGYNLPVCGRGLFVADWAPEKDEKV